MYFENKIEIGISFHSNEKIAFSEINTIMAHIILIICNNNLYPLFQFVYSIVNEIISFN